MDETIRWAKRAYYAALIFGTLQTGVAIASWLGWQPKLSNLQPIPSGQFFLSGMCFVFLALTWFALQRHRPMITSYEAFRNPKWETVTGHTFSNESLDIDGKRFVDCKFNNAKLVPHGNAPTDFLGNNEFGGTLELTTDNPATMEYLKIESKLNSLPGARTKRSAVDSKGNTIPRALEVTGTPATPLPRRISEFCKDLSAYLKDRPPRADEDTLWNETGGDKEQFIRRYQEGIQRWDDKLAAGYWLRFRQGAIDFTNELELADQHDDQLEAALRELDQPPTKNYAKAMQIAIEQFRLLASKLD